MKFSELMCLGMKNICENIVANKQIWEKLLRWRLYTSICTRRIQSKLQNDTYDIVFNMSFSTLCIWTYDTYMH